MHLIGGFLMGYGLSGLFITHNLSITQGVLFIVLGLGVGIYGFVKK